MALSEEFDGDELVDAREHFFREAETAGRLQHQNIVTIFDAGEEHDLAYIAMEFLRGKDLVDYCRDGHLLPVSRVLSIVARVAEALAYAHRQNVVHRDIKPANIMYEAESDTVKVTDFGIARITDSSKTKTGLVLGTPSFMSPEQLAGKKVDGRSDLYSLAVMMFQMLTGVLPFRGDSMAELMYKIANDPAPDIRAIRKELPEGLAKLVALALSKRPEARYQNGDQLAADLRSIMGTMRDKPAADQPQRAPASGPANPGVDQKTQVFGAAIPASGLDMMRSGDKGKDNAAVFTATVPGLPAGSVKPAASPRAMAPMPETPRRGGGTDIEI
jgi:serine/threonine-protein kinase